MAQDLERLVVQLSADIKKYENSLNRAMGVTNQRARQIESRFSAMNKTILAQSSALGSGIGKGLAAFGGAKAFQQLSDAATGIRNSLKVAGLSGADLEKTFDLLYASAQRNSAPIESLAQLYSRVSLVQGELGVSSQQIVGLVDNVGKALRLSGSDAQAASGALLQLGQALGSNKVQAEEYGSLIDGLPGILQAAANGIEQAGGSVSKLTQLVKSGKISNKAFFDGIEAGQSVLDERLSGATQTVSQRFTTLHNALIKAADRFNENTHAADALGDEFGRLAGYIGALDFSQLIADLQKVMSFLETGTGKAQAFAEALGKVTGLANIGAGIVDYFDTDHDGKVTAFGGLLGIESTVKNADQLNELTEKRLNLEKQIADIKSNPANVLGPTEVRQLQSQLDAVNQQIASRPTPPITGGPLDYNRFPPPGPAKPTVKPKVDITEDRYKPLADDSSTKARKAKTDDYAREIQQLKDRTTALQAETAAQEGLNPLLNDYGFAVEKAAAKHDLLTAAQEAGKKVTPELAAQIETLSTAYANAVVESQKLAESQDLIKERAEEARDFNKDLTRGIIDGFRQGKSAADVFADALSKISDRLLDMAINGIFDSPSKGGLGLDLFGLIGSIFKREKGGPVRKGQPYVVGEKRPELFVPDQSGTIVPKLPTAPSLPNPSQMASSRGDSFHLTYAPNNNVQGSGPEIDRMRQQMVKDKADFYSNVISAVRKGKSSRDLK